MYALLVLEKHVKAYDHQLFQIRVRDTLIVEMPGYKSSDLALVCGLLQASSEAEILAQRRVLVEILVGTFKNAEHFKWDIHKNSRHRVN